MRALFCRFNYGTSNNGQSIWLICVWSFIWTALNFTMRRWTGLWRKWIITARHFFASVANQLTLAPCIGAYTDYDLPLLLCAYTEQVSVAGTICACVCLCTEWQSFVCITAHCAIGAIKLLNEFNVGLHFLTFHLFVASATSIRQPHEHWFQIYGWVLAIRFALAKWNKSKCHPSNDRGDI